MRCGRGRECSKWSCSANPLKAFLAFTFVPLLVAFVVALLPFASGVKLLVLGRARDGLRDLRRRHGRGGDRRATAQVIGRHSKHVRMRCASGHSRVRSKISGWRTDVADAAAGR